VTCINTQEKKVLK